MFSSRYRLFSEMYNWFSSSNCYTMYLQSKVSFEFEIPNIQYHQQKVRYIFCLYQMEYPYLVLVTILLNH